MPDPSTDRITVRDDGPRAAPTPDAIAAHFPALEVIGLLGQGGMGVVYKARQKRLDRLVALKVLPPDAGGDERFAERFAREARALARLQHPNIVTVYDSGQAGELYYFLMEFVDGRNLRELMAAGRMEPEAALRLVPQICDALEYAHEEGVMHRDIKPENILIDTRGRVRIADFGLAKLLVTDGTRERTLTAPQQVMGTIHYMAPEQVERPSNVDHRADIYALGVVIYEMLTGELPIGRFPVPSERGRVDRRLDEIVLHALEKEPDRRYQRASDIRSDVESLAARVAPAATAATLELPPPGSAPSFLSQAPAPPHPSVYSTPPPTRAPAPSAPGAGPNPGDNVKNPGTAYALWFLCFLGLAGIHRFYLGRWVTGVIWLLTGGLFFIGQLVDLFLIPGMTRISNIEAQLVAQDARRQQG